MLRKRIIFTLIYNEGFFVQSRNFRLQRVGDINWLEKNYKFKKIAESLDELIILNASRISKDVNDFALIVNRLVENVFLPVCAGGGINSFQDADLLFKNGADKLVLNTALHKNKSLVSEIVNVYGSQSVVASVDCKLSANNNYDIYINNGSERLNVGLKEYINIVQDLGVGEIYLNSIDKDGTGFGYEMSLINEASSISNLPLIIAGGAGNEKHLADGLSIRNVEAVATANLFNFVGDGLPISREFLLKNGYNLANHI